MQLKENAAVGEIFWLAHELERRDPNPLSFSVQWIPGHAGIDGNDRAHWAEMEEPNHIELRHQERAATPFVQPPTYAFNPYDPECTVLNIKWAFRKTAKTKLEARGKLPEASISLGVFRRHEMVKMRKLKAQAGITPARTQQWARAVRERRAAVTGAAALEDQDYSLLTRKQ